MIDLLLDAAGDSPLLLAVVVIGGFAVWASERLFGVNGPITRALRAWQERELRKLRREQQVDDALRRRRADRDEYVASLEEEVDRLRAENRRLRDPSGRARPAPEPPATEPIEGRSRRNSGRRPPPPR